VGRTLGRVSLLRNYWGKLAPGSAARITFILHIELCLAGAGHFWLRNRNKHLASKLPIKTPSARHMNYVFTNFHGHDPKGILRKLYPGVFSLWGKVW
jgi:hypothetical protein